MATVSRLSNTGIMYTSGEIDEVTNNLAAQGSILFNGTTQYLNTPSNSAFTLGTGDFTIETWIYQTTTSTGAYKLIIQDNLYSSAGGWGLFSYNNGLTLWKGGGVTTPVELIAPAGTIPLNTWTHVAWSRSSGSNKLFINGAQVGSTVSDSTNYTGTTLYIGASVTTAVSFVGFYFTGYISNLRVVKGIAVYTGAFTTPPQPLQKTQPAGTNISAITNAANTSLLLSTLYNDAFKDLSDNNFTVSPTASPTSTVQHPFNPNIYTSVLFNGTSSYISAPYNANQLFGTNDFTIEGWIYPTSFTGTPWIISTWYGTGGQYIIRINTGGRLQFVYNNAAAPGGTTITATTTLLTINNWFHIAVVRNSATITLYVNGVADATTGSVSGVTISYYNDIAKDIYLGRAGTSSTNYFNGYMYNLRLVNGTAVYTSSFSPPTVPLTNITNTQLLLFLSKTSALVDNSSYSSGPALTLTNTASLFPGQSMATPPIPISYADTGLPVSKQYSNGALQIVGSLDEVALNTNLNGSVFFTAASAQLLSLPSSGGFGLGTGDFTIEFWANWAIVGASAPGNVITTNINTTGLSIYVTQSSLQISRLNVASDLSVSVSQVTGRWDHYAFVRISGTAYIYKNGVLIGSGAVSTNYAQNGLTIGTDLNRSGYTTGYVSNVRIVKGIGVYTGAFTPPTRPLNTLQPAEANIAALTDASRTSLLLRTLKTNVYDDSIYNVAITKLPAATPPPSTKQSPFLPSTTGYFSGFFNGTTQYLTVPNNVALQFGAGDFTIEMWMYFNSLATASQFLNFYTSGGAGGNECYTFSVSTGGVITYYLSSTGATFDIASGVSMGSAITVNRWNHIALVRSGSTFTPYINGIAGTTATSSATLYATASPLYIGAYYNGSAASLFYSGYISNLRVVKGIAVYTGAFTPPTSPLQTTQASGTNIAAIASASNTSLLTCQSSAFIDNSTNGFTVTATGATISNSITPFGAILNNVTPTISANTTMRKQYNNGTIQIINDFDEYTSIA